MSKFLRYLLSRQSWPRIRADAVRGGFGVEKDFVTRGPFRRNWLRRCSGSGLKSFRAGVGFERPDITHASRRIKESEQDLCAKDGIEGIIEVKAG